MKNALLLSALLLGAFSLAGCGEGSHCCNSSTDSTGAIDTDKYLIDSEPDGAVSVLELKKKAEDGDKVLVVGQLGNSNPPAWIDGKLAFFIVDLSLEPCKAAKEFCCYEPKELADGMILVKFVDAAGNTVSGDVSAGFGLKWLDRVVVSGTLEKSEDKIVVRADKMFVRK